MIMIMIDLLQTHILRPSLSGLFKIFGVPGMWPISGTITDPCGFSVVNGSGDAGLDISSPELYIFTCNLSVQRHLLNNDNARNIGTC